MINKINQLIHKIEYKSLLIIKGHIFNPLWHSRNERRRRREEIKRNGIQKYLNIYKSEIESITPTKCNTTENEDRIFTMWLQGEENAPDIVKACIRSMRSTLKSDVTVLDESNIFDWISLPSYIITKWKQGYINAAHFSDLCRVEILHRYGGIWLDATAFVTSPIPNFIMDSDFFVYMAGEKISSWYSYIQNCFIRARKCDPLLGIWREAMLTYWKYENSAINYYIHQLIFEFITKNNKIASDRFSVMPKLNQDPTHTLWFMHKDEPFDERKYTEYTKDTFFQKTTYRDKSAESPAPASVADFILNSNKS